METFNIEEKDGKIKCVLTQKWLCATPEERVRQNCIAYFAHVLGYALEQMEREVTVANGKRGLGRARADLVVWKSEEEKEERKYPFIVLECKAEKVRLHKEDYYQGCNYASWAHADFFVITNEKETKCFQLKPGHMPDVELVEVAAIPTAGEAKDQNAIEAIKNKTKLFTRKEFTGALRACHNIIRNNDALSPEAAFDEISKLLFMKIRWERQNQGKKVFTKEEYVAQSAYYEENVRPGLKNNGLDQSFMQNLFSTTIVE